MSETTEKTDDTKVMLPEVMPAGGQVVAIVPQSVEEMFRVAKGVVQSGLAPYALTGKMETERDLKRAVSAVAIVVMAGAELGLPPMVSLRSFTAINGRPALYGDGLINVVRRSGRARLIKVGYTHGHDWRLFVRAGILPEPQGDTPEELAEERQRIIKIFEAMPIDERVGGYCEAERADTGEKKTVVFSTAQAKRAGLWQGDTPTVKKMVWDGPQGQRRQVEKDMPNDSPWFRYEERMSGWRAAGFCLRDLFGDALGGITDDWEAREISGMIDLNPSSEQPQQQQQPRERAPVIESDVPKPPAPPADDEQADFVHEEPQQDQAPAPVVEEKPEPPAKVAQPEQPIPEAQFVPNGTIGKEERAILEQLEGELILAGDEPTVIEAFDNFEVEGIDGVSPQVIFGDNQAAIAEAFKIRDARIAALHTEDRKALEAEGQGALFGDVPMPPEGE